MARRKEPTVIDPNLKRRKGSSPEARENQLIALSFDLVEQRLIDGTATSQETTHFLRLASQKYKLEQDKLRKEIALLESKKEAVDASRKTEEMYAEAIAAVKSYASPVTYSGDYNNHEQDVY